MLFWHQNPCNLPPYPEENTPMWFHMARHLLQQDLNHKIAAIRAQWNLHRQCAMQSLGGDMLTQALAASNNYEAEELAQVQREFDANWHNLNLSTSLP